MNPEDLSRKQFIRLGGAIAFVPAGAAALAACGGETSSNGGGGDAADPPPPEETTQTAAPEETAEPAEETTGVASNGAIARESEVPPGSAVPFEDGGEPAVLVRLDSGEFVAYSAVCTHRGCTVAYEEGSGELACPCHGSVFDPANGAAVVGGPATSPLPEVPIAERDGSVVRA